MCFAALGSDVRLEIFRQLVDSSPTGLGPTALSELMGLPRNLISYHLTPLRACGLVANEKDGRDVLYRVSQDAFADFAIAVQRLMMRRA
ncbi:ArsR/SmtB family transcription factor [Qipengyuania sp. MTN3-11]|uniref:ArsR/SmtB family transcription factor n=1 Tax=Qipengyuania sp. MTN3-11 TaxID=3056557 RepID=UPI0036F1E0C3